MLSSKRWLDQPSLRITSLRTMVSGIALLALLVPGTSSAVQLRDGVVLDLDASVAFLMTPAGAIEAVDLARGSALWSSTDAAKPLALSGDMLIAQGEARESGALDVVALDRNQGSRRMAARIELPEGVWAPINDSPVSKMRTYAEAQDGEIVVSWLALRTKEDGPLQGYLPSDDPVTPKAARRLQGQARFDLSTGAATAVPASKAAAFSSPRNLDLVTEKPLKGISGRQYTSADGRHLLASERIADNSVWKRYEWRLYERASGKLVGMMHHHVAAAPFVVQGQTLIFESRAHGVRQGEKLVDRPLEIRAIDLVSGSELWSKSVRPTEFEGPFAP